MIENDVLIDRGNKRSKDIERETNAANETGGALPMPLPSRCAGVHRYFTQNAIWSYNVASERSP